MDAAKRQKKLGSSFMRRGGGPASSETARQPTSDEALKKYYERMVALDHKLESNLEKQRMRR